MLYQPIEHVAPDKSLWSCHSNLHVKLVVVSAWPNCTHWHKVTWWRYHSLRKFGQRVKITGNSTRGKTHDSSDTPWLWRIYTTHLDCDGSTRHTLTVTDLHDTRWLWRIYTTHVDCDGSTRHTLTVTDLHDTRWLWRIYTTHLDCDGPTPVLSHVHDCAVESCVPSWLAAILISIMTCSNPNIHHDLQQS